MSKVHFPLNVDEDGSVRIPVFAIRGMGFEPGDNLSIAMPLESLNCDTVCENNEVFLTRCCSDNYCHGYSVDGDAVNIPARLFVKAQIPVGSPIQLLAGDNALVLVAGTGLCEDLACEIDCLLTELGMEIDPCVTLGADF